MMGRKTLREVRQELEGALSGGAPPPPGEVAESLARFLSGPGRAEAGSDKPPVADESADTHPANRA